jgi:hypothetical protein
MIFIASWGEAGGGGVPKSSILSGDVVYFMLISTIVSTMLPITNRDESRTTPTPRNAWLNAFIAF